MLSKEKADRLKIWDEISRAYEADEPVEGVIVSRVKGGLSVDIGVKAFLPGSQVDLRPVRNLESLDRRAARVQDHQVQQAARQHRALAPRAAREGARDASARRRSRRSRTGQIVDGVIKNLTDYGAFIDLGGIDGLLHVTDMSWGRVNHPSELFQVGDEIKVKVLKFDPETERVSLGLKQIQPDPWIDAAHALPDREARAAARSSRSPTTARSSSSSRASRASSTSPRCRGPSASSTRRRSSRSATWSRRSCSTSTSASRKISLGMKQIEPNPWSLIEEKYPVGTRVRGHGPQHHQLRALRRARRGDRRPRARLRHLVDGADQAPGREVQEGRRGRGDRAQDRQGEREVLARHQAARRRTRGTTSRGRYPLGTRDRRARSRASPTSARSCGSRTASRG